MERTQSSTAPFPPRPEEVAKALHGGLPALDFARSHGLGQLAHVRDAKARSLAREPMLLALKHDGAQPARVDEAQQRFKVNEHFRREIAVVRELAETAAPGTSNDTMIVHGFVRRRSDHAGLPGLTLALTDADGTWLRELGYACTDKRGYFILEIKARGRTDPDEKSGDVRPPAGISVEDAKKEAEAKAAAAAAGRTEASAAATNVPPARDLQLRIFDSQGRSVHTESRPVVLQLASIDYRYILIGDDSAECACTPPPAKAGGKPAATGPEVTPGAPAPVATRPVPTPAEPRVSTLKPVEPPAPRPVSAEGKTPEKPLSVDPPATPEPGTGAAVPVRQETPPAPASPKTTPKASAPEAKMPEAAPEAKPVAKKTSPTRKAPAKKKKES